MNAGDRFKGWIEGLSESWKDRLRGWMMSWLAKGLNSMVAEVEPGLSLSVEDTLLNVRNDPDTPPALRDLIDKVTAPGHPLPMLLIIPIAVLMLIPTLTSIFQPLGNLWVYKQERVLKTARFDPISVITAWRRDPVTYNKYFDDLRDQGWNDERIEALKFVTLFIPSAQDQITWLAREVFEPEMIERYGLKDELPEYAETDFAKIGVDEKQMANYWMAHWEHASYIQVVEMLHRGLLTLGKEMPPPPTTAAGWATRDAEGLKAIYDWYRLVEIPPFWRSRLTEMSWNVPTRVDVRRFWDMRTISEERMRSIYHAMGYHGVDLEDYILWTKVYGAFPELLARYKNGWITLDQVKQELVAIGMLPARADEMIEEKIKKAAPERVATEKDLTKADIIKGVKKGVISRTQGAELLADIGYSNDEAVYLLDVNIPTDEETSVKTARELTKADILSGLKADVITEADALSKLLELRYTSADADFLLKVYKAAAAPPTEPKLREASKADIVTAVKKGLITQEAGYLMLLDIGFAADAALFILSVATEESPFSPMTFDEFKDRTQRYRLAAGMEGKPMAEEIKKLGAEVVRLTGEVTALQRSIKEEQDKLLDTTLLPQEATARMTELQVTLHRAEAELARVKTDYNAKLAEWRHRE